MKWALLSDVHANLPALEACLAFVANAGAERVAILGDLVGYGAQPGLVVERVQSLQAQGAVVLQGNHDQAAAGPPSTPVHAAADRQSETAAWTHRQLSDTQRRYLADLPLTHRDESLLLVHASAHQPGRWHYVDGERAAGSCLDAALEPHPGTHLVICGHVHHQRLFYRGTGRGLMRFDPHPGVPVKLARHRKWVATIGSVGQPRDGNPRAMCAMYDSHTDMLSFHRVAYDVQPAIEAIVQSDMPKDLAQRMTERLERGL